MKQLLAMLSRTADGAMVVDPNGTVAHWNRAAERLLGFRAAEVVGRPCHDVLRGKTLDGRPLCSPACPIERRAAGGEAVRNFDLQTRTKTGRTVWLNISILPVASRQKGRFHAVYLFRDVTRLAKVRRLEDELHAALCEMPATCQELRATAHTGPPPDPSPTLPLSTRELDVLRHLAQGRSTREIADALCVSPATVRNHIQHILDKLGAHSRLQALAIAFRPGLPP